MSEPIFTDKCLPAEWQDEVIPDLGGSPTDFLCLRDGQIWLVGLEDREAFLKGGLDRDDAHAPFRSIPIGDEVEFQFTRADFPDIRFRVLDDGAIVLIDDVPEGANLFGCGHAGFIEDEPLTAARQMFEDDPDCREIECWYWSDSVTYIVCMDAACVPYFERKGAVQ